MVEKKEIKSKIRACYNLKMHFVVRYRRSSVVPQLMFAEIHGFVSWKDVICM